MSPLQSLVASGTKLWLDSIDPELVKTNRQRGATGATSNPIIVSDILAKGGSDDEADELFAQITDDEAVAWQLTDRLVTGAQQVFEPVWQQTKGDDGYVSFELDPLLEDPDRKLSAAEKARQYVELGKRWAKGQRNRMIKVPATDGGLLALEDLAAAGVTLNVTLIFTERQYRAARDAVWKGAQRRADGTAKFKSVYSIFVSRVDVYTKKHVPELSPAAQGQVGLVNAKRLWRDNLAFWGAKGLPLCQEIIFASTGAKLEGDAPDKYVAALAGSDIQTNPPETNDAVEKLGKTYARAVDGMPAQAVLDEIDAKVDQARLESVLMAEGVKKFADPHKKLLATIAAKRAERVLARV